MKQRRPSRSNVIKAKQPKSNVTWIGREAIQSMYEQQLYPTHAETEQLKKAAKELNLSVRTLRASA